MPDELLYLYGITPADTPDPSGVEGIDGGAVRLVRSGPLAAAVSAVDPAQYSDEQIEARLSDLQWVGDRGLAHERVLDWLTEHGPVVPLSLFSLHAGEERVGDRLRSEEDRLVATLESLRGRREWGVKLWRGAEVEEHLATLSPVVAGLTREMEEAPPGRRFLLSKKLDQLRAEEVRRVGARVSHEVYSALRSEAERSTTVPLPPPTDQAPRTLVLHAAFLLEDAAFPAFQRRLTELAGTFQTIGFQFEFTGPWPPYHFAESDGS